MGAEVLIPLALSAVATGAQIYNQRQTAHRQDQALANQIRAQSAKQREADQQTAQLIAQQAKSTDADEKSTALGQFQQAIQRNQGNAQRPLAMQGDVSAAYKKAGSDAALGMGKYAGQIADLVSSIDAPFQQRQNDSYLTDRYKTNIGLIRRNNEGDNYLAQLRLRSIRPNPWISAGSSLLGGYARSRAGAAGSDTGSDTDWTDLLTTGMGY